MTKTFDKTTETRPETLTDDALEQAQGGFSIDPNGERVADGEGSTKIITGAGVGGGPHVKVFNGRTS